MNVPPKEKPPPKLVLISVLSGGLTIFFSSVYICLSILGIIFRFNCNAYPSESVPASGTFMQTILRVYILQSSCDDSIYIEGITSDYSVFVLNAITLSVSAVTAIAAIVLISAITSISTVRYLNILVITYVAFSVCSLIVDLTFGVHFGSDYTFLTNKLDEDPTYFILETLRLGSMLLMTLSLKGFVFHFINTVFIVLMVTYITEFMMNKSMSAHSIHKLGAIQAYESGRRNCNHYCEICQPPNRRGLSTVGSNGGSQLNYGFVNDDERSRSPPRGNPRSDYTNFDRSNSWQPGNSSRPFTYLDEVRRPAPARPPPSPSNTGQWRQPWQPPVPVPDYSPQSPRRLKPALKSYM
ncbi:hypothetical protein ACJJTC_000608 [Scirpophaga incertulas]